jgi:hypothetical protein
MDMRVLCLFHYKVTRLFISSRYLVFFRGRQPFQQKHDEGARDITSSAVLGSGCNVKEKRLFVVSMKWQLRREERREGVLLPEPG